MKNLDTYLADFLSPSARRKVYSLSALLSIALTAFAGNEALSGAFDGLNPIFVGIFSGIAAIVSLLARANVNDDDAESTDVDTTDEWDGTVYEEEVEEEEGDEDYVPRHLSFD